MVEQGQIGEMLLHPVSHAPPRPRHVHSADLHAGQAAAFHVDVQLGVLPGDARCVSACVHSLSMLPTCQRQTRAIPPVHMSRPASAMVASLFDVAGVFGNIVGVSVESCARHVRRRWCARAGVYARGCPVIWERVDI